MCPGYAPSPDSKKAAHIEVWRPSWTGSAWQQLPGQAQSSHDPRPHLPGQAGQRAADQVSGVHLLNLSLTEFLISEAFSLVLSHIELSDEVPVPSLVIVSVGWEGVEPFMEDPSIEPCS